MSTDLHTDAPALSGLLRSRTTGDHRSAERSGFPSALMGGDVPLEGYVDLLAQHRYAYEALERTRSAHLGDPELGPFLDARLLRGDALEADLADLAGVDWRAHHPPSSATAAYVGALEATIDRPIAHLGHHYTRYLGDLSGGQHIGRAVARWYGLSSEYGGRFSSFAGIGDLAAYRDAYRARLDALAWTSAQREELIEAVHEAYAHNEAVFADLGRHVA